jgi:long-chain acyl-CoA synthetase
MFPPLEEATHLNTLNLADILEYAARRTPEKTFIVAGERRETFAEVNREVQRFANVLARLGVRPGDKVALLLPNDPLFVTCYYGALRLGAVPVAINTSSPGPEIAYFLSDSEAAALVAHEAVLPAALEGFQQQQSCRHLLVANFPTSEVCPQLALRLATLMASVGDESFPLPATAPLEPATILYTSGTTGHPKGAVLSHLNLWFTNNLVAKELWGITQHDVVLIAAPMGHIFGQVLLNASCVAQAMVSFMPRFDMELFLQTIERDRVTFFAGVPTLALYMLNSPAVQKYDLSSLRTVMFGGAPLAHEVMERFRERFGVEVLTGYGLTEALPVTFRTAGMKIPPGSVGVPVMGARMRIIDEEGNDVRPGEPGEIVARGPMIFSGYYNRPEATAEALRGDWFHTGDIGYVDDGGYLFLVDRLKDMIKRSGYAVFPAEIERVLQGHPAVSEAVAVGIPDPTLGEEIKAFVVLRPEAEANEAELLAHCAQRLAAYKVPRWVELRPSLPKNPAGKLLRRALRG